MASILSTGLSEIGEAPTAYNALRDFCYLQRDTRLDHTLVFQVDEFWAMRRAGRRRAGAFRPQWSYLKAHTVGDPSERYSAEDPFGVFQVTALDSEKSQAGDQKEKKKLSRKDYFVPLGYELEPTDPEDGESTRSIDRIPFMWDFGFLMCKQRPWLDAFNENLTFANAGGEKVKVGEVWQALPKAVEEKINEEQVSTQSPEAPAKRPCWRAFLEACKIVAKKEALKISAAVSAFDIGIIAPESFACLVLEIWASEIYDKSPESAANLKSQVCKRKWQAQPGRLGLIDWLSEDQPLESIYRKGAQNDQAPLKKYSLELYKAWLLLVEVLNLPELLNSFRTSEFKIRNADPSAVAARNWYKSASAFAEHISPTDPLVPVSLPGHFSVRGDWFLAVAGGSRSGRLADRALDLLSSQRANFTRLQMGLGLPTRNLGLGMPASGLGGSDEYRHLRTKLFSTDSSERVTYASLLSIGAQAANDAAGDEQFHWFWRSGLEYYHRHVRIWQRWLIRMLLLWERLRYDEGDKWVNGFVLYDEITQGDFERAQTIGSWEMFPRMCDFLIAELKQSSPGRNSEPDSSGR